MVVNHGNRVSISGGRDEPWQSRCRSRDCIIFTLKKKMKNRSAAEDSDKSIRSEAGNDLFREFQRLKQKSIEEATNQLQQQQQQQLTPASAAASIGSVPAK